MINSPFKKIKSFGLDISDLSLKIAKLKEGKDGLNLASFGETEIPTGIIEGGEVKDENSLSKIIKKSLTQVHGEKLKTKYLIASLPEEKSFLDILQIPLLKEEEMEKAVRFEAENHIPLPLDEVYLDFKKIENVFNQRKYQEILIAAAPKKVVDSYLKTLKKAGLQPIAFEVECLAIVRALIKKEATTRPLLIIDFGATRTSFIIFSGRSLRFTSTIPISSYALTENIAKNLKVSLKKAEVMKKKYGLIGKKEISDSIIPALTDLVEQIKTHLDYYHSHLPKSQIQRDGKRLEKILLCGGGANLKGLVEFLATNLKVEVELGNPWVNILKRPLRKIPELPFEKSLAYTTALGLALKAIYDN